MTNLQSACQPDRKVRRDPPCTLGRPVPHFSETLPSTLPFPRKSPPDGKKGPPELIVPTGLVMSGRLDSNQRPPEPHSRGQGRSQPPNVTNASLLETYEFHSSHSLRRSQPKINDLPTFSRPFRSQACPYPGLDRPPVPYWLRKARRVEYGKPASSRVPRCRQSLSR